MTENDEAGEELLARAISVARSRMRLERMGDLPDRHAAVVEERRLHEERVGKLRLACEQLARRHDREQVLAELRGKGPRTTAQTERGLALAILLEELDHAAARLEGRGT